VTEVKEEEFLFDLSTAHATLLSLRLRSCVDISDRPGLVKGHISRLTHYLD